MQLFPALLLLRLVLLVTSQDSNCPGTVTSPMSREANGRIILNKSALYVRNGTCAWLIKVCPGAQRNVTLSAVTCRGQLRLYAGRPGRSTLLRAGCAALRGGLTLPAVETLYVTLGGRNSSLDLSHAVSGAWRPCGVELVYIYVAAGVLGLALLIVVLACLTYHCVRSRRRLTGLDKQRLSQVPGYPSGPYGYHDYEYPPAYAPPPQGHLSPPPPPGYWLGGGALGPAHASPVYAPLGHAPLELVAYPRSPTWPAERAVYEGYYYRPSRYSDYDLYNLRKF